MLQPNLYLLLSAVTEQKLGPILEAALLKVNTRNKLLSNPHHTLSSQGAPAQSEGWQSGEGHCKVESSIVFLLDLFPQHRFRAMLSAEESRSTGAVRMRIAKQLAEVLFTINSNTAKLQQLEYISSLREHLLKKRMFSFGHCPNYPSSPPPPLLSGNLYIFFGRQR